MFSLFPKRSALRGAVKPIKLISIASFCVAFLFSVDAFANAEGPSNSTDMCQITSEKAHHFEIPRSFIPGFSRYNRIHFGKKLAIDIWEDPITTGVIHINSVDNTQCAAMTFFVDEYSVIVSWEPATQNFLLYEIFSSNHAWFFTSAAPAHPNDRAFAITEMFMSENMRTTLPNGKVTRFTLSRTVETTDYGKTWHVLPHSLNWSPDVSGAKDYEGVPPDFPAHTGDIMNPSIEVSCGILPKDKTYIRYNPGMTRGQLAPC